jgi:hypothetical protein
VLPGRRSTPGLVFRAERRELSRRITALGVPADGTFDRAIHLRSAAASRRSGDPGRRFGDAGASG